MLYLYAIIDRPGEMSLPEVGLADQPIFCCQNGGIGAVVSMVDPQQVTTEATHIWRHETVVETLAEAGGTLPVRFGTFLADEAAVCAMLAERREAFVTGLDQVRGRVEISLRAIWTDPPPPPPVVEERPRSGRDYIERRMAEERAAALRRLRAEQTADDLYVRLDRYAVASIRKVLPTERMLLSAAYLVAREDVPRFQAGVAEIGRDRPDIRLLCTGPWPAYHFVSPA
ncbi:Gas vesicle synthesis GvpLGvpF [Oscillochloris trichoides DG-6]|uniref:Gas vesicle synthesis GvpLGvpF n=1 Tax=Oscillochloris trichoides DG-6 TaxID=765420 RepID=E1IGU3_9CHLR|nr:GvpL/GvpF family gas vesicle protein [Oscillochloris trichoides]EFO79418.1 Gas vesicle synthesis GvpLGvpF [Oscillochloris trichoides DG-6]